MFCSFCDPFFQLDQTCATPSDRSGPPAAGRPRHSACQSGLGENLDFRLFQPVLLLPGCACQPCLCKPPPWQKNWCSCSQLKTSFQETLRRQFGMIGPRLLEHPPLEELNPEMKIRCVFKIEVWRALERSGCFGFRSGELQQNSTCVCKPHQKQPFTCTSFDGRQSNIS